MKIADEALLKEQESPEWKESAVEEMCLSNTLKFENCPHAHEYLLQTTGNIVEAMNNLFWALGSHQI